MTVQIQNSSFTFLWFKWSARLKRAVSSIKAQNHLKQKIGRAFCKYHEAKLIPSVAHCYQQYSLDTKNL